MILMRIVISGMVDWYLPGLVHGFVGTRRVIEFILIKVHRSSLTRVCQERS